MTVEQIELRKILTQMLADNGINRETIKGFVEEIVSEKVDRAIDRIIHETNMDSLIARQVQDTIRTTISDEVRWNVRRVLGSVWHCEPGKAAKDYVPKQEEGEADVR